MIPTTEVSLLLKGWRDDKRLVRVLAILGGTHFSAFCRVYDVTEDGFSFIVGNNSVDMIGFLFDGWSFDFGDAEPHDSGLAVGGKVESAIVGANRGMKLFLMLLEAA